MYKFGIQEIAIMTEYLLGRYIPITEVKLIQFDNVSGNNQGSNSVPSRNVCVWIHLKHCYNTVGGSFLFSPLSLSVDKRHEEENG